MKDVDSRVFFGPNRKYQIFKSCLLATCFVSCLLAQDDVDEDEVLLLSPFEVTTSKDTGYRSTNSTSGTSLDTPIRDIPISLEVINREFLDDTQATDLEESLAYSGGVFTESFRTGSSAVTQFSDNSPSAIGNINDQFQNNVIIRGYNVPNQQRNGFRLGGSIPVYGVVFGGGTDTITVERAEVVRGPQSLLYGINVLSGIVNIVGKRPLPEYSGSVSAAAGNYGFLRTSADFTGPVIKDKLNFRVMGAYQEEGSPVMFLESERRNLAVQFDWKITSMASLFVEYVNSDMTVRGNGPRYFTDPGSGGLSGFSNFTNLYGENIRYGRDDPNAPIRDVFGVVYENPMVIDPGNDYYDRYQDMGIYFNISGPDTYKNQEENNILALLDITPNENLSLQLGVYHTEVDSLSRNVDLRVFNDAFEVIAPDSDVLMGRTVTETPNSVLWRQNPEVMAVYNRYLEAHGLPEGSLDALDPTYHWIGQAFSFPIERDLIGSTDLYPNQTFRSYRTYQSPLTESDSDYYDFLARRFATYVWYEQPFSANSNQIRGRVAYNFETDFLGIPAQHNLILGYHFIEDTVDFVQGGVYGGFSSGNPNNFYNRHYTAEKLDRDPVYFRDSVLDLEPIRYEGNVLARPGTVNFGQLPGLNKGNSSIARSGWKEATVWHRGMYGAYQGSFWGDRVSLIGGARRDAYQVKEKEYLLILDNDHLTDVDRWMGTGQATVLYDDFIGFGDEPYTYRDDLPLALNQAIEEDINTLRSSKPNGTIEHLFADTQEFTTFTAGITFRVIDPVSVYLLYSEGVFPNTGQRDGNDQAIEAEQTVNQEIGVKFDLWGGKISGTISAFRIQRENAVYYFASAPAPHKWHGGLNEPVDHSNEWTFAPMLVDGPDSSGTYLNGQHIPLNYGVAMEYVALAFEELGLTLPAPKQDSQGNALAYSGAEFREYADDTVITERGSAAYMTVPYDQIVNNPNAAPIKHAFDLAMQNAQVRHGETGELVDFHTSPLLWSQQDLQIQNASEGMGANILYEEEGIGVDGQIIFSPIRNYQMVFGFSHVEREVSGNGFKLVDPIAQDTEINQTYGIVGENFGTEYDRWVYVLGPENFTDPTRPSTFTGGSVRGLNLNPAPETSLRLWNVYRFEDGLLKGFSVGGGIQWNSSVQTATPIGGSNLIENRYLTPDLPAHHEVEAMLSYRRKIGEVDWRFQFNVRNLFDDNYDMPVATYTNTYGGTEYRRFEKVYDRREFRFSVSAKF